MYASELNESILFGEREPYSHLFFLRAGALGSCRFRWRGQEISVASAFIGRLILPIVVALLWRQAARRDETYGTPTYTQAVQ